MTCRTNRATGDLTRLAVQEESCWGSLAVGQTPYGVDFANETLRDDIGDVQSGLIRGDRMEDESTQGNFRPSGDITGELQPNGPWPLFAKHALGGSVTTTGSAPYNHGLQGSLTLPEGLTVEKRFGFPDGSTYRWLQYRGSLVNELFMAIPIEGKVTARVQLMSRQEKEVTSDMHASPQYPTQNTAFDTFNGSIFMDLNGNGTRTRIGSIKSINLLLNNNLGGDEFAIDNLRYRADIPVGNRMISGNMVAFFTAENWQLYQAYKNNRSLSMDIILSRALTYSWHFTIPKFKVRGNVTPQVSGRGPIELNVDWRAHRDEDLGTDIQLAIQNMDPVISTAA